MIPDFLMQTPEEEERDARVQEALRASHTRAKLTDEERQLARGVQLEQMALMNLGEAYAMKGEYAKAAEVHPLKEKQDEFKLIQGAIDAPDEPCQCPRKEAEDPNNPNQKFSNSPRRKIRDIYSPKHKGIVALTYCDDCKTFNARPSSGQMLEIEGALAQSDAAKKAVVSDAQVLKAKE